MGRPTCTQAEFLRFCDNVSKDRGEKALSDLLMHLEASSKTWGAGLSGDLPVESHEPRSLLTTLESARVRELFQAIDCDDDGIVTKEVRSLCTTWHDIIYIPVCTQEIVSAHGGDGEGL